MWYICIFTIVFEMRTQLKFLVAVILDAELFRIQLIRQ